MKAYWWLTNTIYGDPSGEAETICRAILTLPLVGRGEQLVEEDERMGVRASTIAFMRLG